MAIHSARTMVDGVDITEYPISRADIEPHKGNQTWLEKYAPHLVYTHDGDSGPNHSQQVQKVQAISKQMHVIHTKLRSKHLDARTERSLCSRLASFRPQLREVQREMEKDGIKSYSEAILYKDIDRMIIEETDKVLQEGDDRTRTEAKYASKISRIQQLYLGDQLSTKAYRITIAQTASRLHELQKNREDLSRVSTTERQLPTADFVYESSDESSDGFEIVSDSSAQDRELQRLLDASDRGEDTPRSSGILQSVRSFLRL